MGTYRVKSRGGAPERWAAGDRDELRRLWDDGVPVREICARLGLTKNQVLGKAHRMGLEKRAGAATPRRGRAVSAPERPLMVSRGQPKVSPHPGFTVPPLAETGGVPLAEASAGAVLGVTLADVGPRGCLFAVTAHSAGPSGHRFCNEERLGDGPYCEGHAARAYKVELPKSGDE